MTELEKMRICYSLQISSCNNTCVRRYQTANGGDPCIGCEYQPADNVMFNTYIVGFSDGLREVEKQLDLQSILEKQSEILDLLKGHKAFLLRSK